MLLRAKIEANEPVDLSTTDVHDVAALFKLWVRELPEPLTTFDVYDLISTAVELDGEAKFAFMKKVLAKIPDANRIALKKVLLMLQKYATYPANKMTEKNLAVVFAPALFRARQADLKGMADAGKYVAITQYLLEQTEALL